MTPILSHQAVSQVKIEIEALGIYSGSSRCSGGCYSSYRTSHSFDGIRFSYQTFRIRSDICSSVRTTYAAERLPQKPGCFGLYC